MQSITFVLQCSLSHHDVHLAVESIPCGFDLQEVEKMIESMDRSPKGTGESHLLFTVLAARVGKFGSGSGRPHR